MITTPIYFLLLFASMLLASLLCFLLYGWDKFQSHRRGWRVAEIHLHLAALLGGWPGAYFGSAVFHHKTHKQPFRAIRVLTVTGHLAAVIALYTLTR